MDSQKFFGRWYRLTMDKGGGRVGSYVVKSGTPAMDIKFRVDYARAQTAKKGTISILGLGLKTIQKYTSLAAMDKGKALKTGLHVKLEAGYLYGEKFTIFDGYATSATCGTPPELWLNIEVWEYNPFGGPIIEVPAMTKDTKRTLSQVIGTIIGKINKTEGSGYSFVDATRGRVCGNIKVPELGAISGTTKEILSRMGEILNQEITFSLHDNTIFAYDKSDTLSSSTGGLLLLSQETGLLSVDGINPVNGCVTTFLKKPARTISNVQVISKLNPHANGKYVLIRLEHIGHYNGREWYTKFHCAGRTK